MVQINQSLGNNAFERDLESSRLLKEELVFVRNQKRISGIENLFSPRSWDLYYNILYYTYTYSYFPLVFEARRIRETSKDLETFWNPGAAKSGISTPNVQIWQILIVFHLSFLLQTLGFVPCVLLRRKLPPSQSSAQNWLVNGLKLLQGWGFLVFLDFDFLDWTWKTLVILSKCNCHCCLLVGHLRHRQNSATTTVTRKSRQRL